MLRLNLNKRILIIFSLCLLALFGASLYLFHSAQEAQIDSIRQQWANKGKKFNDQIGAQFLERYSDVQAFSENALLRDGKPSDITRSLNRFIGIYSFYDLIVYADAKGNIVATNSVDSKGQALDTAGLDRMNVAQTPWFAAAIAGKYTEDTAKGLIGTYVEDIQIDPLTSKAHKKPRIGLSFSTAVRDGEGRVVGVISARSSLRWLEHEVSNTYLSAVESGLEETEITVLNKRGEIVVDYDPSLRKTRDMVQDFDVLLKTNLVQLGQPAAQAAIRGESGLMEAQHARKHINQLNVYQSISDEGFLDSLGWCFLLRVEEKALFKSIDQARQIFYASSLVVLLLCLLSAGLFATHISRQLQRIAGGIKESEAAVDGFSTQLSHASEGLASSATEVASSLEETVASLEELVSMVKVNAENSDEAAQLAKASSQTAKEGEKEVQSLIVAINDISQSSRKIEEIINVIDDIAFQTNLLALNAAVEAARAGDQGRGFAVVAEAVRNLAQRSGMAAKEITKLIQDNGEKIGQGTRVADRSGQVLQNILRSVSKVADLNQEIAAASQEQSTGLTQISKAMNEIDLATQRNAAASEQVSTSSGELKGRADALKTMVSQLSTLVSGQADGTAVAPKDAVVGNVTPIHRPLAKRSKPQAAKRVSGAKDIIPFDDEEPKAKISGTQGF